MSKLLISYINDWAAGTVTASSEHPSFPAINTQHRWYKKPWRSGYGSGSGAGLFRITAANQNIYFGEQKIVDGTMETWASATDLTNWTESLTGTSTVNREATIKKNGSYSCRFDIDGASSYVYIYQSIVLVAGAAGRLSFWHYTPVGQVIRVSLRDSASNVYLQSDGTWGAGAGYANFNGTGTWAYVSVDFNVHASYTNYIAMIRSGSGMVSQSQYVDNFVVSSRLTAALTVGDYNTTALVAEIKSKMEAAGDLTYTPSYSSTTMKFAIAASSQFIGQVSNHTNAAWDTLGYPDDYTNDSIPTTNYTASYIRIHTSDFLYCDAGASIDLRALIIKNHNFQSDAVVTVRYYSDAFVTLVDSETLTWHSGQIAIRTAKNYRYFAIEISDPDNPDGYVEVGLVWAGDADVLHYGFTMDRSMIPEDPSVVTESDDGQESTIQRTKFKGWPYNFDAVEPNTDRPLLLAIFEEIGKTRPCFIVEAPPDSGDIGEDAEYVTLPEWEWTHIAGLYWALALGVRTQR